MSAQPQYPPNDEGERPADAQEPDTAKSFFDQLEAWLKRAIIFLGSMFKGFFLFFVHRLPKWTYEVVSEFIRRISHYLGQVGRIVVYSALVVVLAVAFVALLVGIPVGLNALGVPVLVTAIVGVLEVIAVGFAASRYLWKKWKAHQIKKRPAELVLPVCDGCGYDATEFPKPPGVCPRCENKWVGRKVKV